ncbi:L,D-transpeptidase [Nocardioides speluncae]|uniref:L,D-transpeptidase n=1 Tax=Nocardioides speluncae TaxID=2670337 RepID=UPI000D68FF0A|nr:Ig-like domain-containing protein [Nocardioides speluncae]
MTVRRARVFGAPARKRPVAAALAVAVLAGIALAGCSDSSGDGSDSSTSAAGEDGSEERPAAEPVTISTNLKSRQGVPVDRLLEVTADNGELTKVKVASAEGALPGKVAEDGASWTATERFEPGQQYTITTVATDADGKSQRATQRFTTADLTLDQQTYPSVAPLQGETVGVGMPVVISFDIPITDQASIEKHLKVTSSPAQQGSWHWVSDQEVHWRPKVYWKAGSKVTVDADINSVPAGGGVFGQEDRHITFDIGDAVISKVNAQTHQMQTFVNGKLMKTTPITTGKPGFTTRSGVKVIMEKYRTKRMNSETVGISRDDPEAYDINDVEYAMRVTSSGEFLHAAPWSVGSQGSANVSHGCTGMSTENAAWIYNLSKRGDVVEYTGTDRPMDLTNGYGDWNASWADYQAGSALR